MAIAEPAGLSGDYADLFRACLARSAEQSRARIGQAEGSLQYQDLAQALHTLSYVLKVDELWPAARDLVLTLAPRMERDGWREELRAVLDSALARSQELGDRTAEAELHWHLGVLHQLHARYAEACTHLEASAAHFEQQQLWRDQARALNRLAYTARRQRRLAEAEHLAERARSLLDAGDPEVAYGLFVLGSVALDRRQWQRARDAFEQALHQLSDGQDHRLLAWACVNLGVALVHLEHVPEAMDCYLRGIELFQRVGDPVHCAVARMDLGVVYAMRGEPWPALAQYAEAEPVFRKTADVNRLAMVYNNIGYAHGLLRQWAEAEHFYRLSTERARESGNIAEAANALDNLGMACAAQGRQRDAVVAFEAALRELAKAKDDSGCQALLDEVTAHLEEVKRAANGAVVTGASE